MVLENKFDRGDEMDADKVSVTLTEKAGYAPGTLAAFLARLDDRNKDQPAQNGLFASHPETKERIDAIRKLAGAKTGATVEARYKENIKYEPTPVTAIATVEDGAAGLAGSTKPKDGKNADKSKDKKEDTPKKGFGLGALKPASRPNARAPRCPPPADRADSGPDRAAKGGGNPTVVKVSVTDAELAAFKKGIV